MSEPLSQDQVRENFRRAATARRAARDRSAPSKGVDLSRYLKALEDERRDSEALLRERRAEQIELRKKVWLDLIDPRWKDARLDSIRDPNAIRILKDRINRHVTRSGLNNTSMLVSGTYGRGKTYVGYAYAYELISSGVLLPSQVFHDTEQALVKIASSGFQKAENLQRMLSPQYRFYLIDDVGRGSYSTPGQRGEVWYELLNHVYTKRLTIVLTTNLIAKRDATNGQTVESWIGHAGTERLRHLVGASGNLVMTGENMRVKVAAKLEEDHAKRSRNGS